MTRVAFSALTRVVSPREVRQFRARRPDSEAAARRWFSVAIMVVVVAAWIFGGSTVIAIVVAISVALGFVGLGIVPIAVGIIILAAITFAIVRAVGTARARTVAKLRLTEFARDNALIYLSDSPGPHYPGVIFGHGRNRVTTDRFWRSEGRAIDVANYSYDDKVEMSIMIADVTVKKSHPWGYVAVTLDRNLPHIVLAARGTSGIGGALPTSFARDQVLSLEGDFDSHFTLYCPTGYERDALYILTPDLMALLIDGASAMDVEIIDNQLFLYSAEPFDLLGPATWQRIFTIVDTIGAKAARQTDYYADHRIGDRAVDLVTPRGQRLRTA